jgi:hypothetical protein
MRRDRYGPYSLFDAVPQLALRFEPELAVVDRLLDDARRAHERQRWFRRACRFRTGAEGRISLLRRRFGLQRRRYRGEAGVERWVGWGVLAHDLRAIGRATTRRQAA